MTELRLEIQVIILRARMVDRALIYGRAISEIAILRSKSHAIDDIESILSLPDDKVDDQGSRCAVRWFQSTSVWRVRNYDHVAQLAEL